jgi:hypothetical protein
MPVNHIVDGLAYLGHEEGSGLAQRGRNSSGGSLAVGDVVVASTGQAEDPFDIAFTTTTTLGDDGVIGVITDGPISDNRAGPAQVRGHVAVVKVNGTTDIAVGDWLESYSAVGIASKAAGAQGAFARALEVYTTDDSAGEIKALIMQPPGMRRLSDSVKLYFGTGRDASIYYDGSNLYLKPDDVGSGSVIVPSGSLFLNETAHAQVTQGLVLNQGANDNLIFALKSSDVATGLTTITGQDVETDDYFVIGKQSATQGGTQIQSMAEDDSLTNTLQFGVYGGTASSTKGSSGRALIEFSAYEHDGANAKANITADGNIFGIRAQVGGTDITRWMVDEDGDTWQSGSAFINETANANMSIGLTINQGTSTDEILALKSNVAHGITDRTETDTFAFFKELNATGGLHIEATNGGVGIVGTNIQSSAGTENATKSTGGDAIVQFKCSKLSGTNYTIPTTASTNLFAIAAHGTKRLFVDLEGDLHLDAGGGAGTGSVTTDHTAGIIGYNTYDEYPDWQLARALKASLVPPDHELQKRYAGLVDRFRPVFARNGIVTYNDYVDGSPGKDGHHFIAMKKLALFQLDGLYQLGEAFMGLAQAMRDAGLKLPPKAERLLTLGEGV